MVDARTKLKMQEVSYRFSLAVYQYFPEICVSQNIVTKHMEVMGSCKNYQKGMQLANLHSSINSIIDILMTEWN